MPTLMANFPGVTHENYQSLTMSQVNALVGFLRQQQE